MLEESDLRVGGREVWSGEITGLPNIEWNCQWNEFSLYQDQIPDSDVLIAMQIRNWKGSMKDICVDSERNLDTNKITITNTKLKWKHKWKSKCKSYHSQCGLNFQLWLGEMEMVVVMFTTGARLNCWRPWMKSVRVASSRHRRRFRNHCKEAIQVSTTAVDSIPERRWWKLATPEGCTIGSEWMRWCCWWWCWQQQRRLLRPSCWVNDRDES